jgi:hypothetical protein
MKDYNQAGSLWVRLLKAKYMSERNFFKSKKYMDLSFERASTKLNTSSNEGLCTK